MSPRRVLHLRSGTHLFGPERIILSLARHASPDYEPIIGGLERDKPGLLLTEAAAAGLETVWFASKRRFDPKVVARLADFIGERAVAIIHAHDFKANFYALAARRRAPVKAVATLHLWNRSSLRTAVYEALDALLVRRFDRVIAVSPQIAAEARRRLVPSRKLRVILNGVDLERFPPLPARFRQSRVVIGSVGRLVKQKGYHNLLAALAEITKSVPEVELLLVGDGPQRGELEQQARRLGLSSQVTFAGQCDPVEESYGKFDLFVSSSLSEGLPVTVLEAMASGLPIVATHVGATPEVIEDGRSGLLVPPNDVKALSEALLCLIKDRELAMRLATAGHERAGQRFSAEAMTRQTESVYEEMLHDCGK